MRNKFLLTVLAGLMFTGAQAQSDGFNKFFIEAGGGAVVPIHDFTSGYKIDQPTFFNAELGLRYMFNEYAGLRLSGDYDKFSEGKNSAAFETSAWAVNLEGVANVGRLLKFEDWTKTFNVLAHAGFGAGQLTYDIPVDEKDLVGHILGGFTVQAKLFPRLVLYADVTGKENFRQNLNFDGHGYASSDHPVVLTGTLGLSVALGKNSESADWYLREANQLAAINNRIDALASDLAANTSKDGQLAGKTDGLGRKVDDLERKLNAQAPAQSTDADAVIAKLINDGYVNIYFDLGSSKPQVNSLSAINTLRSYLAAHSGATVQLLGYADERGTEEFNVKLSQKRADAVAKLLTDAGIDASRISAEGKGEDLAVSKTNTAYQLARRVSFIVK
ncbi:MAG: OmpA family protein [Bacteroidales bacterium]|nr:OmpA family protein [Bacteroidales bacterium]